MAAPFDLQTPDSLQYNFYPNSTGFAQFRVRCTNDAHIALTMGAAESDPMYEVHIGGWNNSRSVIRKNRTKPDKVEVPTPGILHGGEFRGFWLRWNNNNISCGRENESQPFISWTDHEFIPISYIGFCTGWGASGSWVIEQPQGGGGGGMPAGGMPPGGMQSRFGGGPQGRYQQGGGNFGGSTCQACWVAGSNGSVPPNGFVGGEDNGQPLYVIRANVQGALIPGKLLPSHGTGYVPWGGSEHGVTQYEVLCDHRGQWQACSGGNIPPNALSAGQSETGEPLFVGRVVHNGTLTIGKVQQSHGVCYIPYGGQELNFPQYEILTA